MLIFRNIFGLCLLICCVVFETPVWSKQPIDSLENVNPSPEIIGAMIPEIQKKIMNGITGFAVEYNGSTNAVKKFLLRKKRQQFLAEHLKDRVLSGWIGRIRKLLTTSNGKAYLEIELAMVPPKNSAENKNAMEFNVTMGTWNNAFTDLDYNTLILPGTSLHSWLANFNEGQWVVFSGNSFAGKEDYLKEASPTETEAMLSPLFIIKFELLENVDFPESDIQVIESLPKTGRQISEKIAKSKKLSTLNSKSSNSKSTKITKSKKLSILFRPELTIRYYQDYRLSNNDWNFQSYIERRSELVNYHWRNHPPTDYLSGSKPEGGEVFVMANVEKSGIVSSYQVNSSGDISDIMREVAKDAMLLVPLPPLPEEFPDEELKVEFRFDYPPMTHFSASNTNQLKGVSPPKNNKSVKGKVNLSKMAKKIFKKQHLALKRSLFHEELRQEFSSHFKPHQRFDPSLELKIELGINRLGKVVEQKLTQPGESVKFQLAVLNGLNQARFGKLPKSLHSETPYRVRLRVIP